MMINNWFFLNVVRRRTPKVRIRKNDMHVVHFWMPSREEIERDYEQAKSLQAIGIENDSIKLEMLLNGFQKI